MSELYTTDIECRDTHSLTEIEMKSYLYYKSEEATLICLPSNSLDFAESRQKLM